MTGRAHGGERRAPDAKAAPFATDRAPCIPQPTRPGASASAADGDLAERVRFLEFRNAILTNRLAHHEPEPQPWPRGLPAIYRPEAFTARVQALASSSELIEAVRQIECDEFPCIAFVDLSTGKGISSEAFDAAIEAFATAEFGPGAKVLPRQTFAENDDGSNEWTGAFAIVPPDADLAAVKRRFWDRQGLAGPSEP